MTNTQTTDMLLDRLVPLPYLDTGIGVTFYLYYNENNINNTIIQIRGKVDAQVVYTETTINDISLMFYRMAHVGWFKTLYDRGNLYYLPDIEQQRE